MHGEARLPLPALPEFEHVLAELNIAPEIEMLPTQSARGLDTIEDAQQQLAARLYLAPGSPQENRLRDHKEARFKRLDKTGNGPN